MTKPKHKKKKRASARSSHRRAPSPSAQIPDFSKIFESDAEDDTMARDRKTDPGALVAKNDARIDKAIEETLERKPEQWANSAAALKNYVHKQRKGEKKLETKLKTAVEAKATEAQRIADILARKPDFGPGEIFEDFKMRRFARLFVQKPQMFDYFKSLAENATCDEGRKDKIKFYEDIAGDAETFVLYVEDLCVTEDATGKLVKGTECSYRETLDAMDWFADNMYAETCDIYDEYKDIPSKEMFKLDNVRPSNLVG